MQSGGQCLRVLREQLGLTMRDVENASEAIAARHKSDEFAIPPSRLSDIETKGVVPSIYRIYSLSVIYRRDASELLSFFGVDLNRTSEDLSLANPPKSHVSEALQNTSSPHIPVRLYPSFFLPATVNMARAVEQSCLVPLPYLAHSVDRK